MKDNSGRYIFGVCKVSEKGQIVIPKEARDVFDIKPGDSMLMLGDVNQGLALVKTDIFQAVADTILNPKDNDQTK